MDTSVNKTFVLERQKRVTLAKRVLHIVPGMHGGGIENWISGVAREIGTLGYHFDVLVPGDKVDETFARQASKYVTIIRAPRFGNRLDFFRAVGRQIKDGGPYCGVHTHLCASNAIVIAIARILGVPATVAHAHIDLRQERLTPLKRLYRRISAEYLALFCGRRLACGLNAAHSEFSSTWAHGPRVETLTGIDEQAFLNLGDDAGGLRAALGIPEGAAVVTHIGRFEIQKNHSFLIKVFASTVKRKSGIMLLLIGSGPLEAKIARIICDEGLESNVQLLGHRCDAVRILLEATDVFLFPSIYEGLPLAVLEAQTAGVPCVISSSISSEVTVISRNVSVLSLKESAENWASAVIYALEKSQSEARILEIPEMRRRGMTIRANAEQLAAEYSRQIARGVNTR